MDQSNLLPLFCLYPEGHISGDILSEIQYRFPGGCMDQLRRESLMIPDGYIVGSGRNDSAEVSLAFPLKPG